MNLRPTLSLVYGVRIAAADVDRVRALCDAGALPGCEVWDGGKAAQPYAIVGATASLRPLLTDDGTLADGLPLDVRAATHLDPEAAVFFKLADAGDKLHRLDPRVSVSAFAWWIVGRVS